MKIAPMGMKTVEELRTALAERRPNWNPKHGEQHPKAKLNRDLVIEIRRQAAAGVSAYSLAKTLGVSSKTVRQVIARATWRHVSEE